MTAPAPLPPGGVPRREEGRDGVRLAVDLDLTPSLPAFQGHFPGTPMLPAVAQVDWAVRMAREHFALPPRVAGLRSLKFLRVVQPPVRLTLELTLAPDARSVTFAYQHRGAPCATGRIEFADDSAGPDRPLL